MLLHQGSLANEHLFSYNPAGVKYIIMEKAGGVSIDTKWFSHDQARETQAGFQRRGCRGEVF
jgi:hypothetical protein